MRKQVRIDLKKRNEHLEAELVVLLETQSLCERLKEVEIEQFHKYEALEKELEKAKEKIIRWTTSGRKTHDMLIDKNWKECLGYDGISKRYENTNLSSHIKFKPSTETQNNSIDVDFIKPTEIQNNSINVEVIKSTEIQDNSTYEKGSIVSDLFASLFPEFDISVCSDTNCYPEYIDYRRGVEYNRTNKSIL
ncbi:hypothetical protein ACR2XN_27925 [Klebsiella pneumoniae]